MSRQKHDPRFERLVREWQQPVYGLALRMLGDPGEAEDATQEVFVRLLRDLERYDPDREFRPWIYRVATNLMLNRIRARKTRREKEGAAARERAEAVEDSTVEQSEMEGVVRDQLQHLEQEDRAMLVLHFYEGLSKSEAADALGVPRTTLHARLDRALGRLKSGLQAAGHAALVPLVPTVMREATPPMVPPALRETLLKLAIGASKAAVPLAGVAVMGGAVMAKKTIIAATVLALGSLGIGYLAGHESAPRATTARGESRDGYDVPERQRWEERNRELTAKLDASERERDDLRRKLVAGGATDPKSDEKAAAIPASGVEWTKFAKLIADNHELIFRLQDDEGAAESATPEEKARIMKLLEEFMRVSSHAKSISNTPIFDNRIFPELVDALYTKTLDLSPDESAAWLDVARSVRAAHTEKFDPVTALPLVRHAARLRMIADLKTKLATRVPADQQKRFEDTHAMAESMVTGTHEAMRLDLAQEGGDEAIAGRVVHTWSEAYMLTEEQRAEALELALSFVRDARDRYRQQSMGTPGADEKRYDESVLKLQIAIETRLIDKLSDDQKMQGVPRLPVLIRFRSGEGEQSMIVHSGF